jgi:hypothetical protein
MRPVKNDVGLKVSGMYSVFCECIKEKYWINFKDTTVLVRMTCYVDCIVQEAIEIQLHPKNCNRDMGFSKSVFAKLLLLQSQFYPEKLMEPQSNKMDIVY